MAARRDVRIPRWVLAAGLLTYVVVHLEVWTVAAAHFDSAPFTVIETVAVAIAAIPVVVLIRLWGSRVGSRNADVDIL